MENNLYKVITIDGPAGSGKSTIAKLIAEKLNILHIDSGLIYRGFTYAFINQIGYLSNPEEFGLMFSREPYKEINLKVDFENRNQKVFLSGVDITSYLRDIELTKRIRYIANNIFYRNKVNQMIREIAKERFIVVDGRDMGSEVFPNAFFKFYLYANIETRAQRRWKEYQEKNLNINIEMIKEEIRLRDDQDTKREVGALKIPKNSIVIDTSYLSRNMVLNLLLVYIQYRF